MKRVIHFRVRCVGKGSPTFCVRIFPDKRAMKAWASQENPDRTTSYAKAEASVHAYRRLRLTQGRWHRHADTGWIVFHMGHIGAGIVSHEMTHAALYYLQLWRPQLHRRLQTSRNADEVLAWVQGWLVAQFWRKFYKAHGGTVKATGSYRRRHSRNSVRGMWSLSYAPREVIGGRWLLPRGRHGSRGG